MNRFLQWGLIWIVLNVPVHTKERGEVGFFDDIEKVEIEFDIFGGEALILYNDEWKSKAKIFYVQKKRLVAYKDEENGQCLIEKVEKKLWNLNGFNSEERYKKKYKVSKIPLKTGQVEKLGGKKISKFCAKQRTVLLKVESNTDKLRVKREENLLRGSESNVSHQEISKRLLEDLAHAENLASNFAGKGVKRNAEAGVRHPSGLAKERQHTGADYHAHIRNNIYPGGHAIDPIDITSSVTITAGRQHSFWPHTSSQPSQFSSSAYHNATAFQGSFSPSSSNQNISGQHFHRAHQDSSPYPPSPGKNSVHYPASSNSKPEPGSSYYHFPSMSKPQPSSAHFPPSSTGKTHGPAQYPPSSTSKSQGPAQYPPSSTSKSQGPAHYPPSSTSKTQGPAHYPPSSTSRTQGPAHYPPSSTSKSQGPAQYPPSSTSKSQGPAQYPPSSTSKSQGPAHYPPSSTSKSQGPAQYPPSSTSKSQGPAQYPPSSTSKSQGPAHYPPSSTSKSQGPAHYPPSSTSRTQGPAQYPPSSTSKTQGPAQYPPSSTSKSQGPAHYPPSSTSKSQGPAHYPPSSTSKSQGPAQYPPSSTSKTQGPAQYPPSSTSKSQGPAHYPPSSTSKSQGPAHYPPSSTSRTQGPAQYPPSSISKSETDKYHHYPSMSGQSHSYSPYYPPSASVQSQHGPIHHPAPASSKSQHTPSYYSPSSSGKPYNGPINHTLSNTPHQSLPYYPPSSSSKPQKTPVHYPPSAASISHSTYGYYPVTHVGKPQPGSYHPPSTSGYYPPSTGNIHPGHQNVSVESSGISDHYPPSQTMHHSPSVGQEHHSSHIPPSSHNYHPQNATLFQQSLYSTHTLPPIYAPQFPPSSTSKIPAPQTQYPIKTNYLHHNESYDGGNHGHSQSNEHYPFPSSGNIQPIHHTGSNREFQHFNNFPSSSDKTHFHDSSSSVLERPSPESGTTKENGNYPHSSSNGKVNYPEKFDQVRYYSLPAVSATHFSSLRISHFPGGTQQSHHYPSSSTNTVHYSPSSVPQRSGSVPPAQIPQPPTLNHFPPSSTQAVGQVHHFPIQYYPPSATDKHPQQHQRAYYPSSSSKFHHPNQQNTTYAKHILAPSYYPPSSKSKLQSPSDGFHQGKYLPSAGSSQTPAHPPFYPPPSSGKSTIEQGHVQTHPLHAPSFSSNRLHNDSNVEQPPSSRSKLYPNEPQYPSGTGHYPSRLNDSFSHTGRTHSTQYQPNFDLQTQHASNEQVQAPIVPCQSSMYSITTRTVVTPNGIIQRPISTKNGDSPCGNINRGGPIFNSPCGAMSRNDQGGRTKSPCMSNPTNGNQRISMRSAALPGPALIPARRTGEREEYGNSGSVGESQAELLEGYSNFHHKFSQLKASHENSTSEDIEDFEGGGGESEKLQLEPKSDKQKEEKNEEETKAEEKDEDEIEEEVKEGDVLEPGDKILGKDGYTISDGFRGRVVSVTGQIGKTRVEKENKFTKNEKKTNFGQFRYSSELERYVKDNGEKNFSNCKGDLTFTCSEFLGSNGRAKICKPNPRRNPDGSPC